MYMFLTIISMFKCLEFTPYLKMFNRHAFACNIVYLRTEVLLYGLFGGGILILRQKNLSSLLRFLCLSIKIFTVCVVKGFNDCNTKMDHAELLSLSIIHTQKKLKGK